MDASVHGNAVLSVTEFEMLKNAGVLENKNKYTARRMCLGQHLAGLLYPVPDKEIEMVAESLTRKDVSLLSISTSEEMNRVGSVSIVTRLRAGQPRKPDLIPDMDKRFFYSRKRPDQPWVAPRHLGTGSNVVRDTSSSWHAQGRLRRYLLKRRTLTHLPWSKRGPRPSAQTI